MTQPVPEPLVPEWGDFDQSEGEFGDMDPIDAYYAGNIPWDDLTEPEKRQVAEQEARADEASAIHDAKYRDPARVRTLPEDD